VADPRRQRDGPGAERIRGVQQIGGGPWTRDGSIATGVPRVRPFGKFGRMRMCLDDGVLRMVLDLALELGDQMARRDDETPRLDAHGLVLVAAKADESVAPQLAALAPEQDRGILDLSVDPFVELAEHRLIARDATYGDGADLAGVSVRRRSHVVATDRFQYPGPHNEPTLVSDATHDPQRPSPASPKPLRRGPPVTQEAKAHVNPGTCLALDDQQLIRESPDQAKAEPEPGAVISSGHAHAIVGDDDPDPLRFKPDADLETIIRAVADPIAVGVHHCIGDRL
jgi:hypothetical protein